MSCQRVLIDYDPFPIDRKPAPWDRGQLDASFVALPGHHVEPFFVSYRLDISLKEAVSTKIHVTADERYQLFVDGELVGRGSERGDPDHWFYESYQLDLATGEHRIEAFVWSLGNNHAPFAQFMFRHGFLLIAEDKALAPLLTTGKAPWIAREVRGIEMIPRTATFATGDRFRFIGSDAELSWVAAVKSEKPTIEGAGDTFPVRLLRPSMLPNPWRRDWKHFVVRHIDAPADTKTNELRVKNSSDLAPEHDDWASLLNGYSITIPANTRRRVIVDCETYLCSYWSLATSGGKGSTVRLTWAESLYHELTSNEKGNRNEIENKLFGMVWSKALGQGDEVRPAGQDEEYRALWWLAGRYLEIFVETGDEPLVLRNLRFEETRYPLEPSTHPFRCSDPQLDRIADICLRTLQMDCHDTFCDSPYYEQLQYVGDTRIEALMTSLLGDDDRAHRKAILMFDASRSRRGITQSRYPCRNRQYIPPFSLWWILMVADHHEWRGNRELVRAHLPGIRAVLNSYQMLIDPETNLPKAQEDWNFLDWVPAWDAGIPPGGNEKINLGFALQLLLALEATSELESLYGYAQSQRPILMWIQELRKAIKAQVSTDGLIPDEPGGASFCEHTHAIAILSNDQELQRIGARWYDSKPKGPEATFYFQHYRFEALAKLGRHQQMLDSIRKEWGAMVDNGLVCTMEQLEPSRSDCHAWAAHPLLHFQTKILGFHPLEPGRIEFRPHLCDLEWAEGYIATGKGLLHAHVRLKGSSWEATLVVPEGITVSIPDVKGMIAGPRTVTIDPSA
ncbi:MAG: alpha-L-rhamnosidase [Armatimonadota bacterium]